MDNDIIMWFVIGISFICSCIITIYQISKYDDDL